MSISSSALVGSSLSIGYYKPSAKDTAASAIVALGGTDLEYGAVAIGNIARGTNAFVKLQAQNGGGTFDHAGFYTGNNSGTQFVTLPAAIPSPAWIDVFFCGTVAHLRITSAAGVTTLTYNYGSSFGAGAGLGTYGSVRLDNFVGFPNTCKAAETTIRAEDLRRDIDLSHPR